MITDSEHQCRVSGNITEMQTTDLDFVARGLHHTKQGWLVVRMRT